MINNERTMATFPELAPFLSGNANYVAKTNATDPSFLPTLQKGQAPTVLWIGCADSRVPESVVLDSRPGNVFVHRNIANQFHPEDDSANAVLDYGVLHLGATHVVVVGHTSCGGCHAAHAAPFDAEPSNHLSRFLAPLISLRHSLGPDATQAELEVANVCTGVRNVASSETIQTAWRDGRQVFIHGWMYDLGTGHIRDLGITRAPNSEHAENSVHIYGHNAGKNHHHNHNHHDHVHQHAAVTTIEIAQTS